MVVGELFHGQYSSAPSFLRTPTSSHLIATTHHAIIADRVHLGESGLGKTTLINTLFATEICAPRNYRQRWVVTDTIPSTRRHVESFASFSKQLDKTTEVEILKADLEERGFNIKVGQCPLSNSKEPI